MNGFPKLKELNFYKSEVCFKTFSLFPGLTRYNIDSVIDAHPRDKFTEEQAQVIEKFSIKNITHCEDKI